MIRKLSSMRMTAMTIQKNGVKCILILLNQKDRPFLFCCFLSLECGHTLDWKGEHKIQGGDKQPIISSHPEMEKKTDFILAIYQEHSLYQGTHSL